MNIGDRAYLLPSRIPVIIIGMVEEYEYKVQDIDGWKYVVFGWELEPILNGIEKAKKYIN